MKTKLIILVIFFIAFSNITEAQLLKKLKNTAEKAVEKTLINKTDEKVSEAAENKIDDITSGGKATQNPAGSENIVYANPSKEIKTEAKRAFYTHDVVVKTFDKEKQAYTTSYFDANEIAMKSNWNDQNTGNPKTSYIDSEGYFISYNESKNRYEKSNMLSSGVMGMMTPNMMISGYKLPPGPFWEASGKLNEQGLNLNTFMFIEFAFVYKPEHFRDDMYINDYTESSETYRGNSGCTKFSINEPEYSGSYILFDNMDRLAEINVKMKNDANFGSGEGKLEFFYEPCEVKLPAATEVKQPGQDLLMKGLSPGNNN